MKPLYTSLALLLLIPCNKVPIKPTIHAKVDVPIADNMNTFMSGLSFSCPKGYKFDPKTFHSGIFTYKDIINNEAKLECIPE